MARFLVTVVLLIAIVALHGSCHKDDDTDAYIVLGHSQSDFGADLVEPVVQ
jgi:hypothetical protein